MRLLSRKRKENKLWKLKDRKLDRDMEGVQEE